MTRLVLVRHGETTWNADRRMQGQIDVELSDLGRQQAARLAERLAGERFEAAYASDLKRAWETATIALAGHEVQPRPCDGLREIHLGEWQGMTVAEIRARWPEQPERFWDKEPDLAPPGGESRRQLQARVVAAVEQIGAWHPDGQVLLVSHGGALRSLVCWVVGADIGMGRRFEVDNCGVSVVDLSPRRMMVRWNETAHLRGLVDEGAGRAPIA